MEIGSYAHGGLSAATVGRSTSTSATSAGSSSSARFEHRKAQQHQHHHHRHTSPSPRIGRKSLAPRGAGRSTTPTKQLRPAAAPAFQPPTGGGVSTGGLRSRLKSPRGSSGSASTSSSSLGVGGDSLRSSATASPTPAHYRPHAHPRPPQKWSRREETRRALASDSIIYAELDFPPAATSAPTSTSTSTTSTSTAEPQPPPPTLAPEVRGSKSGIIYEALHRDGLLRPVPARANADFQRHRRIRSDESRGRVREAALRSPRPNLRSSASITRQSYPPARKGQPQRPAAPGPKELGAKTFLPTGSPVPSRKRPGSPAPPPAAGKDKPVATSPGASAPSGLDWLQRLERAHQLRDIAYYHRGLDRDMAVAKLGRSCVPDHSFLLRSEQLSSHEVHFTISLKRGTQVMHVPVDISLSSAKVFVGQQAYTSVSALVCAHQEEPVAFEGRPLGFLLHPKMRPSSAKY